MLRNRTAGSLRPTDGGATVTLAGWVARRRDHGGVIFIDLRDASGVVQVVFHSGAAAEQSHALRSEFCVEGEIRCVWHGSDLTDEAPHELRIGAFLRSVDEAL